MNEKDKWKSDCRADSRNKKFASAVESLKEVSEDKDKTIKALFYRINDLENQIQDLQHKERIKK